MNDELEPGTKGPKKKEVPKKHFECTAMTFF